MNIILVIDKLFIEVIQQLAAVGGAVLVMGLFCIALIYYVIYLIKKIDKLSDKQEAALKDKDKKIEEKNQEIMGMLREQINIQNLVKDCNAAMSLRLSEINLALHNNDQLRMKQALMTMSEEMKTKLFDTIEKKTYDNNL